jgi:2-keto-4-pentenoate hydratase
LNAAAAEHDHLATQLRAAYRSGPIDPFALPNADVNTAYRIQEINTQFWTAAGRRIVGRKIGLTSQAVQRQLGVDQPDFGVLFADMEIQNGGMAPMSRLLQPRAEAEVAFVMARDVPNADVTGNELLQAVAYVLPAIEIVDSRIRDWKISLVDTVADNASSALYVVGTDPRNVSAVDLKLCGMALTKNGVTVSTGVGAACLDHPLNAVLWLAKTMAEKGRPLKAGDVVLSGALGPMTGVQAGDAVHAEIAGLGSVSVRFA